MRRRRFEILLVEDNPADVRLTEEALKEASIPFDLQVASDGVNALALLRSQKEQLPDLILLDWNLPRMDGREVLAELKKDDDLKRIPVIVLTTSKAADDIQKAYDMHANCFITKPVNVLQYFEVIRSVESFWMGTVTLPSA